MATDRTGAEERERRLAAHLTRAGELLRTDQVDAADLEVGNALRIASDDVRARNLLGLVRFRAGRYEEAHQVYRELVGRDANDPALRLNLGLVELRLGRNVDAAVNLRHVVEKEPNNQKAQGYLGLALMRAGELKAARVAVDELCAVLSIHSGTEGESKGSLFTHLNALKVDTKQSSLGRFAGTIAFVLGDRAEGSPQFWVYKDRMQPARVRFTDDAKQPWDVRFLDYTSQATGDFFPRIVEVYKGTELHLRLTVLGADTRPELDTLQF